MTLTWLDLLAIFAAATGAYVAGYYVFLAASLVHFWRHKATHDQIVAHLRANPRYPFNLPVVETHAAGEYACEECGSINFFSLIQMAPEQLPPGRLREDARQVLRTVENDVGRGVSERGGVYQAPLVLQCHRCRALLANGDAATMFEGPDHEGD